MNFSFKYVFTKTLYTSLYIVCALGFITISGEATQQSNRGKVERSDKVQTAPIDAKNLEDLFKEGALIARTLGVRSTENSLLDYTDFNNELKFLQTKRTGGGENINDEEAFGGGSRQNVERHGQRSRSATLLVPDIEMSLLNPVGFLYDADKSTIRAYMIRDSHTRFQNMHEGYYNVDSDKSKFDPILDRKEFIEKYKEWRNSIDHLSEKQRLLKLGPTGLLTHNEVIGNFFPDSLVGLVAESDTPENKFKLLGLYQFVKNEMDKDLPMVILNKGKIAVWSPNLKEIAKLANEIPQVVKKMRPELTNESFQKKSKVYQDFLKILGYKLKGYQLINKMLKWNINEKDLLSIDQLVSISEQSPTAKKAKKHE